MILAAGKCEPHFVLKETTDTYYLVKAYFGRALHFAVKEENTWTQGKTFLSFFHMAL